MSRGLPVRGRFGEVLPLVAYALLCAAPAGAQVFEYYHLDALGSVRAVTDEAGNVIERHDYLPFGEECTAGPCSLNPSVGTGQPRRFTGNERDAETALDYFGARYYASHLGRFSTVDPHLGQEAALADPQLWQRYGYARDNPLRFTDPDGRHPVVVGAIVLGVLFVLNNPTNANITEGPTHDTIVPNSVLVAGGTGFLSGGPKQAAKEILEEVTGLFWPRKALSLPTRPPSRLATDVADVRPLQVVREAYDSAVQQFGPITSKNARDFRFWFINQVESAGMRFDEAASGVVRSWRDIKW